MFPSTKEPQHFFWLYHPVEKGSPREPFVRTAYTALNTKVRTMTAAIPSLRCDCALGLVLALSGNPGVGTRVWSPGCQSPGPPTPFTLQYAGKTFPRAK